MQRNKRTEQHNKLLIC